MSVKKTPTEALDEAERLLRAALAEINAARQAKDPAVRSDHAKQARQLSGNGSRVLDGAIEPERPNWGANLVLPGRARPF